MAREGQQERIGAALAKAPVVALRWRPGYRVVPRYPPIEELESFDVGDQAGILAELAAVSPALIGDIARLDRGPLPRGPGASRIITSYAFCRPGRFNDPTVSALYAADSVSTAIAETVYHTRRQLLNARAPDQTLPPRALLEIDIRARSVIDVREISYPELYDPEQYDESRLFGTEVFRKGYEGIVYRSVRRPKGECAAMYAISVLGACRERRTLIYRYEAGRIDVSERLYTEPE